MSELSSDGTRERAANCCCSSLADLALVPMGGNGLDERVFSTLESICVHGGSLWWLYLAKCSRCGQNWMVAQEERIFDTHFLRRLSLSEARRITAEADWPLEFLTYERVLKIGRSMTEPYAFAEDLASSLVWTAKDLRKERPDITILEIAHLLGVSSAHAAHLLSA